MTTLAFIIGMSILGICIVIAAFILSGAISGAAASLKESAPKSLQQPVLNFLTEFDTADYLGLSITELDYIRGEGMLDGTFVAVTSLEQTGSEDYTEFEKGVEVTKNRPIMAQVTRFLFDRELLDKKMIELIRDGKHVNPYRKKSSKKPAQKGKADSKSVEKNDEKSSVKSSKKLAEPQPEPEEDKVDEGVEDTELEPVPGFDAPEEDEED